MIDDCIFCQIIERTAQASIVLEDEKTLAFIDLRQVNPGHVLVIPKVHINSVALIGEAAFQKVPHLHIHVHPRLDNDKHSPGL